MLTLRFSTSIVIRHAISAIYTRFTTSLVEAKGFENGDWLTGKSGDKLVVRLNKAWATG